MKKMLLVYAVVGCLFAPVTVFAQDAIDLHQVEVHSSPKDVADWPVTVIITSLEEHRGASDGLAFTTSPALPDSWQFTPKGWDGSLQYTVWAVARVNGQWHTAGFVQMWRGRPSTGAPMLTDFHSNWAYSDRWGALTQYFPQVGDQMGFFLTAGNARDETGVTSMRERSNVVMINLPANDEGVFHFTPGPTPLPVPVPVPTPAPPAPPVVNYEARISGLEKMLAEVFDVNDELRARIQVLEQNLTEADQRLSARSDELVTKFGVLKLPKGCKVQYFACRLEF